MNALLVDITIICLLIATIFYAYILNRRIQSINQNRDEMKELSEYFSTTLKKSEISISKLKASTSETIQSLTAILKGAQQIRDDLQFLVERGEKIADQLEDGIREKRKMTVSQYVQQIEEKEKTFPSEENIEEEESMSEFKEELMGRLKNLK